jgi:hypothetical protein
MKLTLTEIERTLGQFEAQAIPEDHPVVPQLNDLFGEHTFFLSSNGLNILEPAEGSRAGVQSAKVVNLADWSEAGSSTGTSRARTNRRCHHAWIPTLTRARILSCDLSATVNKSDMR